MPDGARLGARLWLPQSSEAENTAFAVPAILEYIPYRKDDYSAIRDSTTIAWFASQGYASLRVDMRGSGSSDGVLYDEYTDQEVNDGISVIEWLAQQEWCDGNVGMMGISWGGITGLQLAQRAPQALKTVIALGSTEHRYYDDGSYYMGCLVGQTLGWGALMFGYNSRPPDPDLVGEGWRELWLERLQKAPHYLERWFVHQHNDDYWINNTIATDYDAIKIPVFAISGHADCWPNTVSRLLENLSCPVRGMQGAWSHRYPHLGIPGPTVDFLSDALRWFDHWLKEKDTGIMEEDTYQIYIQDSVRPKTFYQNRPGYWVSEPQWPSPNVNPSHLSLGENGLSFTALPKQDQVFSILSRQTVGVASGEYMPWFAFGPCDELPGDQQVEDKESLIFDSAPLTSMLNVVGNAVVTLQVTCDQPQALVAVRLCDIWPDGESTLITRGILNLSQRDGKSTPKKLIPGKIYTIEVKLNHVAYAIKPGNRLRVAISTSYWPIAWPAPSNSTLQVYTAGSGVMLPLRSSEENSSKLTDFGLTKTGESIATTVLREVDQQRRTYIDPESGLHTLEIIADNGKQRFEHSQLEMGSHALQRYSIAADDPLTARAEYEWRWEYSRGDWVTVTETRTVITCDAEYFYLSAELFAMENNREVLKKHWNKKYIRDHF